MLSVEDLIFNYGNTEVLHNISFDIEDRKIISILGPNGVGKTTLLKCLCNLHRPSNGNIMMGDLDLRAMSPRDLGKHISYVPQHVRPSRTTVFDSILIGRRPHIEWSISKSDIKLTWDIIDTLNMRHLALKYVDEISGGEFQKVQLARAIVQEPRLLILDEPTNNLDITNQYITMKLICDLVRKKGISAMLTMHDINLAIQFSDKLLFMKNGNIVEYGGKGIVTLELIKDVYGIDVDIIDHKNTPFIIIHNDE